MRKFDKSFDALFASFVAVRSNIKSDGDSIIKPGVSAKFAGAGMTFGNSLSSGRSCNGGVHAGVSDVGAAVVPESGG